MFRVQAGFAWAFSDGRLSLWKANSFLTAPQVCSIFVLSLKERAFKETTELFAFTKLFLPFVGRAPRGGRRAPREGAGAKQETQAPLPVGWSAVTPKVGESDLQQLA